MTIDTCPKCGQELIEYLCSYYLNLDQPNEFSIECSECGAYLKAELVPSIAFEVSLLVVPVGETASSSA
jgi:transcription elongation factor Elf1